MVSSGICYSGFSRVSKRLSHYRSDYPVGEPGDSENYHIGIPNSATPYFSTDRAPDHNDRNTVVSNNWIKFEENCGSGYINEQDNVNDKSNKLWQLKTSGYIDWIMILLIYSQTITFKHTINK